MNIWLVNLSYFMEGRIRVKVPREFFLRNKVKGIWKCLWRRTVFNSKLLSMIEVREKSKHITAFKVRFLICSSWRWREFGRIKVVIGPFCRPSIFHWSHQVLNDKWVTRAAFSSPVKARSGILSLTCLFLDQLF